MSSFTTNNNTRRTKRARVNGIRPENAESVIHANQNKSIENNVPIKGLATVSGLVDTQIGSQNSKGLLIVGARSHAQFGSRNPDGRSILMGTSGSIGGRLDGLPNDTIANPPYPIRFSGPGHLAFQDEIAIPTIRGDTAITGNLTLSHKNLYVTGDATVNGSLSLDTLSITGTTESTSTTTGALVVPGGVGIAKNLYIGGEIHYDGIKLPDGKHLLNTISTGLHTGGLMSTASATSIDITAGNGLIVDSHTDPDNPTEIDVVWIAFPGVTITNLGNGFTHIYITSAGAVLQSIVEPTATLRRDNIYIGKILHWDGANIAVTSNQPEVGIDIGGQNQDLWRGLGPIILNGNRISANGTNLSIDKSAGDFHQSGVGFTTLKESPNIKNIPLNTVVNMGIVDRNGLIALSDFIIPGNFDDAGTVTTIPGSANRATNQRIYLFNSGNIECQYGQTWYASLSAAQAGIATETHITEEVARTNGVLIAVISVRSGATDLSLTTDAQIFGASKFGEVSIGAAGAATTDLQSAYNNTTTPEIIVDTTRGALSIQDNPTTINANVFEVLDDVGASIMGVHANGTVTCVGDVAVGGDFTCNTGNILMTKAGDQTVVKSDGGNLLFANTDVTGDILFDLASDSNATFFGIRKGSGPLVFAVNGAGEGQTDSFQVQSAIDSTSTTTGALRVTGGAGIVKDLFVGGGVHAKAITSSTSTTTGSLVVDGGVGVAGDLFIGGDITRAIGQLAITSGDSSVKVEDVVITGGAITGVTTLTTTGDVTTGGNITRTIGQLAISSGDSSVKVEDVVITGGAITDVTTLTTTGDITVGGNITKAATLDITSSGGVVTVETVTFAGGAVSGMSTLGVNGNITVGGDIIKNGGTLAISNTSGNVTIESVGINAGVVTGVSVLTTSSNINIGGNIIKGTGDLGITANIGAVDVTASGAININPGTSSAVTIDGAGNNVTNEIKLATIDANDYCFLTTTSGVAGLSRLQASSSVNNNRFHVVNLDGDMDLESSNGVVNITATSDIALDSTGTASSIRMTLGTDTTATAVRIDNNSGAEQFRVDGGGNTVLKRINMTGDLTNSGANIALSKTGDQSIIKSGSGDLIFDNTNTTGDILFDLGSDSTATFFGIRKVSGPLVFAVNGAGEGQTDSFQVQSAIDSTSTTTGALRVTGGVGIVKNVFVGGDLNLSTGTVTQLTNLSTAVTLNARSGKIILSTSGTTILIGNSTTFTVSNNTLNANSLVFMTYVGTLKISVHTNAVSATSFQVQIVNCDDASVTFNGANEINFALIN